MVVREQQYSRRDVAVVPVEAERTSNLRAVPNRQDDAVPVEAALLVAERLARSEWLVVHSWVNAAIPETSASVPAEVARCLENDQMA